MMDEYSLPPALAILNKFCTPTHAVNDIIPPC